MSKSLVISRLTNLLVTALLIPACWAGIQPGNTRPSAMLPHATGDIYTPPSTGGPASANLQDILDYIYNCNGCVDAHNDQQDASMWKPATMPATLAPVLAFEFSGSADITEFGMWTIDGNGAPTLAPIFKGAASPAGPDDFVTNATLTWNPAGTKVKIVGDAGSVYSNAVYNIPIGAFGFYIQSGANYWFSDDELNSNGGPQMLAYLGGNSSSSAGAWTFAYEDTAFDSSDKDFNDFVVKIESMAAVPEPSALLLLATALVILVKCGRFRTVA
jgi:hypothetical protein